MIRTFIQQGNDISDKQVLQGLIPFMVLKEHVIFTCKANPNPVVQRNAKALTEENVEYYQRRIDAKRLKSMQDYIFMSILDEKNHQSIATLFPTSLILAMNIDLSSIMKDNECCKFEITDNVFIVDGQHRMMAMIKLYETLTDKSVKRTENIQTVIDYIEKYKFNCTILVNYDLWEQSQVFVNVNFKQKPVNKSLYYEVFGSEYQENTNNPQRNIIYHAHTLTSRLNKYPESPFYNRIKMLGTGAGYISQAFFVESLMPLFKPGKVWYTDYGKNIDLKSHTAELLTYFIVVKELFSNYWPKENETKGTLICKTTGVGAFVKLMEHIHEKWNDNNNNISKYLSETQEGEMCQPYCTYVKKYLQPLQNKAEEFFGEDSKFLKTSGKATESNLYKTMLNIVENRTISVKTETSNIEAINTDNITEQLQDYLWSNQQDDLDALGHHYDFNDIDNVKMQYSKIHGVNHVLMRFDSDVTIYLDNEGDTGMPYRFPTTAEFNIEKIDNKWSIDAQSIKTSFDTSKIL